MSNLLTKSIQFVVGDPSTLQQKLMDQEAQLQAIKSKIAQALDERNALFIAQDVDGEDTTAQQKVNQKLLDTLASQRERAEVVLVELHSRQAAIGDAIAQREYEAAMQELRLHNASTAELTSDYRIAFASYLHAAAASARINERKAFLWKLIDSYTRTHPGAEIILPEYSEAPDTLEGVYMGGYNPDVTVYKIVFAKPGRPEIPRGLAEAFERVSGHYDR